MGCIGSRAGADSDGVALAFTGADGERSADGPAPLMDGGFACGERVSVDRASGDRVSGARAEASGVEVRAAGE
ncbi:hypothetical protein AWB94_26525 [Mycolicibacterium canariasense]|nr:hypothetical protein AWB94_26525 [Mycolicibacterium canariasense]